MSVNPRGMALHFYIFAIAFASAHLWDWWVAFWILVGGALLLLVTG